MKFLEICISLFKFRRVLIKSIFSFHWKEIIESIIWEEGRYISSIYFFPLFFLVNRVVTSAPSSDVLTNSPPRATKSKTSRNRQKEDRFNRFRPIILHRYPVSCFY